VHPNHAARIRSSPWNDALGGERLRERSLEDAAVIGGDPKQSAAHHRDRRNAAHLMLPVFGAQRTDQASVVAGGRLSPQVELGAIGLDLPPDSEHTQPGQG
jgi:hypothetical protein